jgi:PBP1b-binding outer membrane lipoprotein LpoB
MKKIIAIVLIGILFLMAGCANSGAAKNEVKSCCGLENRAAENFA